MWTLLTRHGLQHTVFFICALLSIAEGLLSAICFHDFDKRHVRQPRRPAATTAPRSAVEQMLGQGGWIQQLHATTETFLTPGIIDASPIQCAVDIAASEGIDKCKTLDTVRASALVLHGEMFLRFDMYYSQAHFHLIGLLDDNLKAQQAAATLFCNAKSCCCHPSFAKKIKQLLATPGSVLASEPLRDLVRSWACDDCSISTVPVERNHRVNGEFLSSRGRAQLDLPRFQAAATLAAHCASHIARGGKPQATFLAESREKAKLALKESAKKPKQDKRPGSPMFLYISKGLTAKRQESSQQEIWTGARVKEVRQELANQWRGLSKKEQQVWIQQNLDSRDQRLAHKRMQVMFGDGHDDSDSDPADKPLDPFQFGNADMPLLEDHVLEEFKKRGTSDIRKLASQVHSMDNSDMIVIDDPSLIGDTYTKPTC